jgi:hypothetical protein
MFRTAILCGFAFTLQAQQSADELLARVHARVADTVGRLSNYMCTETVERKVYVLEAGGSKEPCAGLLAAKGHERLLSSDRLRLDVGASKSGEMYSWAGENRFQSETPGEIVGGGATSNGSFAALLFMIFTMDPVKFSYRGERIEADRLLAEFAFENSLQKSHYTFTERFKVVTAYEGSFLVDPKTFDLVRLTIRTKGLPPETDACEAATTLDYQNVPLNDSILLLPSVARLVIVDTDGTEKVNQTVFSGCHEFLGESAVHFGDAGDTHSLNARVSAPAELPLTKGLSFDVVFMQDIDTSKAAAGDAIRCELATPIRDGGKLLAPAKTPVTARIVESSRIYGRHPSVLLAFRLESFDLDGTVRTFVAHANRAALAGARPVPGGQLRTGEDRKLTIVFSDLSGSMVIKSGWKSKWSTGL